MRLVTLATIVTFFISLILPGVLSFGIRNIPQNDQPSLDRTQKLYEDLIVSQAFVSTTNNFSGIGLSIKNPNLLNKKDVILSIYDRDGILLKTVSLNGASIADGKFVKFKFDSIKISENRQFLFTLMAPSTSREEADKDRALEIFLTNQQPKDAFNLKIGDKVIKGNVSFVVFYKPLYSTYVLEKIYLTWIRTFVADLPFFTIYTILMLTLTGFLIHSFFKKNGN